MNFTSDCDVKRDVYKLQAGLLIWNTIQIEVIMFMFMSWYVQLPVQHAED